MHGPAGRYGVDPTFAVLAARLEQLEGRGYPMVYVLRAVDPGRVGRELGRRTAAAAVDDQITRSLTGLAVVNLGGTLLRILGIRILGDAFSDPILAVNDWIADNRIWLTVLTFGFVFIVAVRSARRGRDEIETPAEMAAQLEAEVVQAEVVEADAVHAEREDEA